MILRFWLTILLWCSAAGTRFRVRFAALVGVVLAVAGLSAVGYGLRVAMAQSCYYRLKYGTLAGARPEEKVPVADRAHASYPSNYYLSQLMAGDFLTHSGEGGWAQREARKTSASDWCERGRRLNPYGRELTWMATGIARLQSPVAAIAIWEPYVDRVFWEPWNLASLISLRVAAGRVDAARELLPLLHGRPEYATAASAIENASR